MIDYSTEGIKDEIVVLVACSLLSQSSLMRLSSVGTSISYKLYPCDFIRYYPIIYLNIMADTSMMSKSYVVFASVDLSESIIPFLNNIYLNYFMKSFIKGKPI